MRLSADVRPHPCNMHASAPERPLWSSYASGHDRRVVVLGPDLLQILEPAAFVHVGRTLTDRVLEVPRLTLVRPVRRVEAVRFAPVRDRGLVFAGEVQILAQLELGGRRGLVA